ncbi:MAG: HD domain-containing protein [Chloroflexi bacterium]|nr:HD domain-containing protein [Chloroflexota bacterium]
MPTLQKTPFNSLRFRLMMLVSLSLVPVLVLMLGVWGWLRESAHQYSRQETGRYAQLILTTLESQLNQTRELLETLSSTLDIDGLDATECGDTMRALITEMPRYLQIGIASPEGDVICSALSHTGNVNIRDRLYFQQAVALNGFALGEYQVGRITGRPSINAAMPIQDVEGELRAVVFVALDLGFFESLFNEFDLPDGSTLLLYHSDGRVLARFPDPHLWVGEFIDETELFAELRQPAPDHLATLTDSDGIQRTYAHFVLEAQSTNPIEFVVGVPTDAATSRINVLLGWMLLVSIAILVVSLSAAWLVGEHTVLKYLRPLLAATERLAETEPNPVALPRMAIREFDVLGQAFEKMSGALLGEIDRRALAERQTRQRLEQLSALRAIDRAILSGTTVEDILVVFLDVACYQLQALSGRLLLAAPGSHELALAAQHFSREGGSEHRNEGHPSLAEYSARTRRIEILRAPSRPLEQGLEEPAPANFCAVPLISKDEIVGVLELELEMSAALDEDWREFALTLAGQAAIAIENTRLLRAIQESRSKIESAYDETIAGWAGALDLRDEETQGHSWRVAQLTVQLAERLGLAAETIVHIRRGALLHDVGKLGIPDEILLKPGQLTEEEWVVMRQHPAHAYEWLSRIEYLRPALEIPLFHHERWDGSGYPEGRRGEAIPIAARIFAVVDVWDALTHARSYRQAWEGEQALDYIRLNAGIHFDPEVVAVFLALLAQNPRQEPEAGQKGEQV